MFGLHIERVDFRIQSSVGNVKKQLRLGITKG